MTIRSCAKNIYMRMRGYTPVKLNDTKNVLRGTQKYKYVKASFDYSNNYSGLMKKTILPSGILVEEFLPRFEEFNYYAKYVHDFKNNRSFSARLKMVRGRLKAQYCRGIHYFKHSKITSLGEWKRKAGKLVKVK